MKPTPENLKILEKLGFTCDFERTGDPRDKLWYSLKDGWGFRLDAIKNFKHLVSRIKKTAKEEETERIN